MEAVEFVLVVTFLLQEPFGLVQQIFQGLVGLGTVAQNVTIDSAQKILQLILSPPGAPHLPGGGVAAREDQSPLAQPQVALAKGNAHQLIAFVKSMLQVVQAHQQPGRFGRTALLGIERTEIAVKDRSVDMIGKSIQRMLPIENLVET